MSSLTLELLTAQLQCAEELDAGRRFMFEPQDLPGRYGRVAGRTQDRADVVKLIQANPDQIDN